jgi:hypothetical protein
MKHYESCGQSDDLSPKSVGCRRKSMNRGWEQEHLAQAYRHIAELRAHIVRQRVLLKDALDTGQPSELAESMLHALEGSLRIFEKHRQLILEQLLDHPSERMHE